MAVVPPFFVITIKNVGYDLAETLKVDIPHEVNGNMFTLRNDPVDGRILEITLPYVPYGFTKLITMDAIDVARHLLYSGEETTVQ